jgi:hypothetical protein
VNFQATLELNGKTATGIEVPSEVVAALGGGQRPAVAVTLNGHTYRTTIGTMGGRQLIPVSAENRAAAGIAAGDVLDVGIELDAAPREVVVPDDLAWVRWIEDAKRPETRTARVTKTIEGLLSGRKTH